MTSIDLSTTFDVTAAYVGNPQQSYRNQYEYSTIGDTVPLAFKSIVSIEFKLCHRTSCFWFFDSLEIPFPFAVTMVLKTHHARAHEPVFIKNRGTHSNQPLIKRPHPHHFHIIPRNTLTLDRATSICSC